MKMTSLDSFNGYAGLDDDQESGGTGTTNSSEIGTMSSKATKARLPFMPETSQMTLNERVTVIVAGFTIVLSIFSMIIEGTVFAIFSGIFAIIMGSFAHYQQTQIAKVTALREKSNMLEQEIVRLKGENTRLSYDVDELEGRVEDLLNVEDALEIITEGQSVDALQKDADANLELVCNMRQSVEANVIEILMSSLDSRKVNDEREMNAPITMEETERMTKKLKSIIGLSVNEARFRQTVLGGSIESIFDAIRNLFDENIPAMDRIFQTK